MCVRGGLGETNPVHVESRWGGVQRSYLYMEGAVTGTLDGQGGMNGMGSVFFPPLHSAPSPFLLLWYLGQLHEVFSLKM